MRHITVWYNWEHDLTALVFVDDYDTWQLNVDDCIHYSLPNYGENLLKQSGFEYICDL